MTGDVFINGTDAFTAWGINFEDGALSALMTPPPAKDYIVNSSRLQHGKRITNNSPKMDSNEYNLPFHLIAVSREDFFSKYANFCTNVLENGVLDITTRYYPGVVFKCIYNSCVQFKEYNQSFATFVLKVTEENPKDRTSSI